MGRNILTMLILSFCVSVVAFTVLLPQPPTPTVPEDATALEVTQTTAARQ